MTVAEKKTQAYLDSIAPDEDRKMMIGYRFLAASKGKITSQPARKKPANAVHKKASLKR